MIGKYRTIVADPPWQVHQPPSWNHGKPGGKANRPVPYQTLSVDEIVALPVAAMADEAFVQRHDTTWFEWPRGEHSAKPDGFLDLVEQVSPGPYLELFARRARFGWDYWGDQSLGTADLPEVA